MPDHIPRIVPVHKSVNNELEVWYFEAYPVTSDSFDDTSQFTMFMGHRHRVQTAQHKLTVRFDLEMRRSRTARQVGLYIIGDIRESAVLEAAYLAI